MSNYVGWYPRRRGILEHLEKGSISLLDSAVHDFLCLTCDYRTGVARASAEKIRILCPSEITLRAVQRSLAHLEKIGWIKRWRTHGQRGNYPILIARFPVYGTSKSDSIFVTDGGTEHDTDVSPRWYRVNAERTTDWRFVQFEPVTDMSPNLSLVVSKAVTDRDTDATPIQEEEVEVRTEKEESKTEKKPWSAVALPDQSSLKHFENRKILTLRSGKIKQVYFEEFEKRFHLKPDFDGSDGRELARFVKRRAEDVDVLVAWLKNAFESDDIPATWVRFRLREWCGRASKFSDGPLRKRKSISVRLENRDPTKFDGVIV
jgi:hypothetical protein